MKYAHPTGLPVEVAVAAERLPDGGVALRISDDGVGLPEGFEEAPDSGVGMKMVHYMIESIGGGIQRTSDELGLTFLIDLPAKKMDGGAA